MAAFYTGTWTDTEEVKKQSGMASNTNISEENDVAIWVKMAEAEITSAIAIRYTLPLSDNTTYSGSPAEYLLQGIAGTLASGYLMKRQYEGQGGSMLDDAEKKIENAKMLLAQLSGCGECPKISLIDTAGDELATKDSGKSSLLGYPNATTDTDDPDDNPNAKFTADMKF